jgi:hypothetical protein
MLRFDRVEQLRAIGVDFGLVYGGVDLSADLSGLDHGTDLHVHFLELRRDLRTYVDEVLGLKHPGGGDRIFEITALGHHGEEGCRPGSPG